MEAAFVSYGRATPYLPVLELLRDYFRIESRDDTRKIREKVTDKLFSLDRALEPALPAMLALLNVPVEDEQWKTLDPSQRRERTLGAVKRLLLRESQEQPLVILFEDLHWIDAETQAVLETLIESVPTARVLLLVTYRPEYRHVWGSKTYYRQLRLDALPTASADELLDSLLGSDPTLTSLKRVLIQRTEGNPFFLEESVRTLVETSVLAGPRGDYRLTRALETLQIPATPQAILAARIDRLDSADKRLLQAAAVIGKDVPLALLEAIGDVDGDALGGGLERLRGAEFLYETPLLPDVGYTFRHALTHEVAYASLLGERRRGLHGRIVDTIERLYPDRRTEHLERLAHHAVRGEVWEKAVAYCRQAGTKAVSRSAYREAVTCFEQALIALGRLPESRDTIEQEIDLRCELRNVFVPLGDLKKCFEHLSVAEPLASSLNDQPRLVRVLGHLSGYFMISADNVRALEVGERALALATAQGNAALETEARYRLTLVHHILGNYSRAIDLGRKVVGPAADDRLRFLGAGIPLFSVVSRWCLAWSLTERGEFAEAIALAEEAIQLAEASASHGRAPACLGLGLVHLHKGDLQRGILALERGLQRSYAVQAPLWLPLTTSHLGSAYVLSGRTAEGLPLLEQAVEQAASLPVWQSGVMINLGQGYLLAGRSEDAMRLAESARELTRDAAPLAAEAQQAGKLPRIGFLGASPAGTPLREAFLQGLRDLGYVEGRNVVIEYRAAEGKVERYPALAAELVALEVDVILTGNTPAALAAKHATRTLPIVVVAGDPVMSGLVTSLAQPGGNVTGLASSAAPDIVGKWVELLRQAVPGVSRFAVLWEPSVLGQRRDKDRLKLAEVAARALGVQLQVVEARSPADFDRAFSDMTRARADALTVLLSNMFMDERRRLVDLAATNRLPAVYQSKEFVDAGGLMSYGPSFADIFRRAATYVNKILKGAKPADLPVEQPTKFELIINLKTAKALGLTIPPSLLARADEVIQ